MIEMSFVRAMKFAAMVVAGLSLAACSTTPNQMTDANAGLGGAGNAAPGSAQDFVVNVGDRVFFESDSSELTPQSVATLDKPRADARESRQLCRQQDSGRTASNDQDVDV